MSQRIPPFEPDALPDAAKTVYQRILAERGYLPGPYRFWLASPEFADRIEPVEAYLRHGVGLLERQVEVVVLVSARFWRSAYVWSSHAPAAARAGVPEAVIEAIRCDRLPAFEVTGDAICHSLAVALLRDRAVDAALWSRASVELGERQVNELLGLLGLYTSVCLTMVAYQMPAKSGAVNPFA